MNINYILLLRWETGTNYLYYSNSKYSNQHQWHGVRNEVGMYLYLISQVDFQLIEWGLKGNYFDNNSQNGLPSG